MENILLKEAIIMANSNNMCRLCLSANGITEPICYDQRDQFLLQKIYECTTLQISPLNGIASSLCTICKARLDEFYQFRWQCIKNDEIIRRIADNFQKQPAPTPTATSTTSGADPQVQVVVHSNATKQEVVEPVETSHGSSAELSVATTDASSSEYGSIGDGRRSDEREMQESAGYQGVEGVPRSQPVPSGYGVGEHVGHPPSGHGQYGLSSSGMVPFPGDHSGSYQPENKYPVGGGVASSAHQQFEFSDFRRKRGRPPKQKYDQYHHPIVKYGENSIDSPDKGQQNSVDSSSMVEEPETILTYGEGSSSRGGDYQQGPPIYDGWSPQTKIKLEQVDHQQQIRYDDQQSSPEVQDIKQDEFLKVPSTSTVQTVLTPDGFVKRSRGRPPREGGCPNQDRTEYRFQCQFCDARFKAAINLKLHTNTHTGERPYKCQLCDKSFAHPSNLSVHTKLHTQERVKREGTQSEKKFQCPYCHTLFALAFQLKIHINTHTGQKPYVCKNCGKGFAQPSNLHVHIKKHCHKRTDFEPQQTHPTDHQHSPSQFPLQHYHHHQPIQQQMQHQHHPLPTVVPQPSAHHQHQHHQQLSPHTDHVPHAAQPPPSVSSTVVSAPVVDHPEQPAPPQPPHPQQDHPMGGQMQSAMLV